MFSACGSVSPAPVDPEPDAAPPVCVAETDLELCSASSACDVITRTDRCGVARTPDCGGCPAGNACTANTCKPLVCDSLDFPSKTAFPTPINDSIFGTFFGGVSASGNTILVHREDCEFTLFLGTLLEDTVGTTTVQIPLGLVPALEVLAQSGPGSMTITGDGLTLITLVLNNPGSFQSHTRSAVGLADFAAPSTATFANINGAGHKSVAFPVISPDGLTFFYRADDGNYEATRASTAAPFSAGTKMPALFQGFTIRAISSDAMSLFVEGPAGMGVLTRASLTKPFVNPNAPAAPPAIPGHATVPTASCHRLIGDCNASAACEGHAVCQFAN